MSYKITILEARINAAKKHLENGTLTKQQYKTVVEAWQQEIDDEKQKATTDCKHPEFCLCNYCPEVENCTSSARVVSTYKGRPIGSQCKGCCFLKDKCTRMGTNGEIGVCWMESTEGEY